ASACRCCASCCPPSGCPGPTCGSRRRADAVPARVIWWWPWTVRRWSWPAGKSWGVQNYGVDPDIEVAHTPPTWGTALARSIEPGHPCAMLRDVVGRAAGLCVTWTTVDGSVGAVAHLEL